MKLSEMKLYGIIPNGTVDTFNEIISKKLFYFKYHLHILYMKLLIRGTHYFIDILMLEIFTYFWCCLYSHI